ncbi:hypothetical protein C7974DRAFT_406316 [Boeremia exigua]|uniref:uncharacterized protein n=1 Tax=Boeremia exigua TaxID=749465 RepID=UPI001E8EECCE|nr:uncharacterized protein C7974DRAFT_406316 [Boeremia exigua]KAH6612770.1 hypothetical protein C7974DRAFT_406316 [Boeremia exigua]
MSDSHDSGPPLCTSHHSACTGNKAGELRGLTLQTQTISEPTYTDPATGTPCFEHSEYFNKQSTKVNTGLHLDGTFNDGGDVAKHCRDEHLPNKNAPVINVDFGHFSVPSRSSPVVLTPPSTKELVCALVHPPAYAFLHGVLSIQWVIGCLFVFRVCDERLVLTAESSVRTEGRCLGMPGVYLEWLCGDHEESSPTEQSMLLTKKYFESLCRVGDVSKRG